jgi:translation elongation factor P/translation initiation factor 5A
MNTMQKIKAQDLKEGMKISCVVNGLQVFAEPLELTEVVIVEEDKGSFVEIEGYTITSKELVFSYFDFDEEIEAFIPSAKTGTFYDYLPEGNFTEEDLWSAIAEQHGLDPSEIMDGDLAEWL